MAENGQGSVGQFGFLASKERPDFAQAMSNISRSTESPCSDGQLSAWSRFRPIDTSTPLGEPVDNSGIGIDNRDHNFSFRLSDDDAALTENQTSEKGLIGIVDQKALASVDWATSRQVRVPQKVSDCVPINTEDLRHLTAIITLPVEDKHFLKAGFKNPHSLVSISPGGPPPKSGGRLLDGRTWDEVPK